MKATVKLGQWIGLGVACGLGFGIVFQSVPNGLVAGAILGLAMAFIETSKSRRRHHC